MVKGWASVAALVVAYDAWAAATGQLTLSAQYKGATDQHPVVMSAVTTYLVVHLWGKWPVKVDPFCAFTLVVRTLAR